MPVKKHIGDATVACSPTTARFPVRRSASAGLDAHRRRVTNEGDLEATVHWHGLRLENRYDGTHETQAPIPVGGSFTYQVDVPDPGAYWYHPHIREDYGQEMGLYGNILVVPGERTHWPPAHRELLLTLDDVLIEDGPIAPSARRDDPRGHGPLRQRPARRRRDGAVARAQRGEVVRLYFTNTANTRVFNVACRELK